MFKKLFTFNTLYYVRVFLIYTSATSASKYLKNGILIIFHLPSEICKIKTSNVKVLLD